MAHHAPIRSWLLSTRSGLVTPFRNARLRHLQRRCESTSSSKTLSRLDRLIANTPTVFLRTRLSALRNAPVTHVVSFLILHEITAVVPLFGLTAAFHYFEYLPEKFSQGEWAINGVKKFGKYFSKKGWISDEEAEDAKLVMEEGRAGEVEDNVAVKKRKTRWLRGEEGTRLVVEFATAYAVVKVLFPLRIMASIWGAPAFASWVMIPLGRLLSKPFVR